MAGSALLGLKNERYSGRFGCCTHAVGFVADDAVDVVSWGNGFGDGDDVEKESLAADLVEDLGAAGFEAGALARGHNCDSKLNDFHTVIIVSWARLRSLG